MHVLPSCANTVSLLLCWTNTPMFLIDTSWNLYLAILLFLKEVTNIVNANRPPKVHLIRNFIEWFEVLGERKNLTTWDHSVTFGDLVFQTKKVHWVTLILHEKEEKHYCFIIFPFFICFHDCNISKCQHSKWSVLFNIGLCYSRGCWTALHIDTVIRCGIVVHCIHSFYYRQYYTILQFLKLIV